MFNKKLLILTIILADSKTYGIKMFIEKSKKNQIVVKHNEVYTQTKTNNKACT